MVGRIDKSMSRNKKSLNCQTDEGLWAVTTRLELATSGVTGRHSNQLNYATVCALQN